MQRVAIVLSSCGELAEPRPVDAELSAAQLDAMLGRAMALAGPPRIGPRGWVVIKPNVVFCPEIGARYLPGSVTDLRIVRGLVERLAGDTRVRRVTIAEGAGGWQPAAVDGWSTDWRGEFDGLSYSGLARGFARRYPRVDFELLDLNFAETVTWSRYTLPRAVAECDCLISLSPLKTNTGAGVSLALKNYFGIAPGAVYGFPKLGLHRMGPLAETIVDLYTFRPLDYAILGGCLGVEGDADRTIRHNVLMAGTDGVAVDAVAAGLMGFAPDEIGFLRVARGRGMDGAAEVCGASVELARRPFLRAARRETAWA